ncbi:MAG: hypothetical protein ABMA64_02080 [Myxococcota bacterium]
MYQEDWLLRHIRWLIEAIAKLARGEAVDPIELDAAVRAAVGFDLHTLDTLPTEALLALFDPTDDRSAERLRVVAAVLSATAPPDATGDRRRAKADAILTHLDG